MVSNAVMMLEEKETPVLQEQPLDVVQPVHSNVDIDADVEAASSYSQADYSVFGPRTKHFIVIMTILSSLFSPMSNFIYLPVIETLARDYNVSVSRMNLSVTTYQILQGIAPLFVGEYGDQVGRRPVYIACFVIYCGANLGLALQHNFAALLVLRAVQSAGSSGTIALGNGVMADIVTPAERGGYITWVQAGIQFGPALSATLGGVLSQFLGWRAIFWGLLIVAAAYLLLYACFVPETARNIVGNGSIAPGPLNSSLLDIRRQRKASTSVKASPSPRRDRERAGPRRCPFPNLLVILRTIFEKDVGLLYLVTSILVTSMYCIMVPLDSFLRREYGFDNLEVGVCYVPFSVGSVAGSFLTGRILDANYARIARSIGLSPDRKKGDDLRRFPIERARLQVALIPSIFGGGVCIAWGWTVASHPPLAAPLILLFACGFALSAPIGALNTLLVDLYPQNPARVTACLNICRCLLAAAGTAVVQELIDACGYGGSFTLIGGIVVASSSALWVCMKHGPRWREERYLRIEKQQAAIAARRGS